VIFLEFRNVMTGTDSFLMWNTLAPRTNSSDGDALVNHCTWIASTLFGGFAPIFLSGMGLWFSAPASCLSYFRMEITDDACMFVDSFFDFLKPFGQHSNCSWKVCQNSPVSSSSVEFGGEERALVAFSTSLTLLVYSCISSCFALTFNFSPLWDCIHQVFTWNVYMLTICFLLFLNLSDCISYFFLA
jgi:hypothetical protein